MWLSADPAMGEYIPRAPIDDDAKKHNQNLPGMGGVYNYVNLHVYHYAGNNPIKLVDPDGRNPFDYSDINALTYNYYDKQIKRGLSLPGISIGNAINSVKNFFSNVFKGEGSLSLQLSARVAGSNLNVSVKFSGGGVTANIDSSIISQLEAVAGTPIRTKYNEQGKLDGLEFHITAGDVAGIGKISAILGGSFDFETGDATAIIGTKLSNLGNSGKTSVSLKLMLRSSTIGDNPTIQGGDFADNFKDTASKEQFNNLWTDEF
jgi:hypothetical protein